MAGREKLQAHLATAHTTVCRCWKIERADGQVFGFTDHDCDLEFDGVTFHAGSGLEARAIEQSSGLAVDNSVAVGALSHASVREADIRAGRFDGAEVWAWLVNWAAPDARMLLFRGSIGEISHAEGQFNAELRGLSEALNQPQGRVYQRACTAVLGDAQCGFSTESPGYVAEIAVDAVEDGRVFRFGALAGFEDGWFERGRFSVLSGEAEGLVGLIKNDRLDGDVREVELWDSVRAGLAPGDRVRIEAGCDKCAETCRFKFNNFINFRGFPHIPGEDWLMSYPTQSGTNTGGSLF